MGLTVHPFFETIIQAYPTNMAHLRPAAQEHGFYCFFWSWENGQLEFGCTWSRAEGKGSPPGRGQVPGKNNNA